MSSESQRRFDITTGYFPFMSMGIFLGATWWLSTRLNSIDNKLEKLEQAQKISLTRTELENYIFRAQKVIPNLPDLPPRQ